MLDGKRILLIISGGIAAYKCLELIRLIKKRGGAVQVILTRSGEEFVTPLSVASLTGEKVFTDLFDLTDETEIGHIELSRSADLVVVAPASADIMARMANGIANNLATTALLATDKKVLIAPAMNVRMWQHAATQRNIAILRSDGILFVGPNEGDMACGEFGPGRMAKPEEILGTITSALGDQIGPLDGKTVLITAGPTHEPIDPVRYIANRSSGKQGYALAQAAYDLGARVILVSGPVSLPLPEGVEMLPVETGQDMLAACLEELPVDIVICAAAVADWRVENPADEKMKKQGKGDVPKFDLTQNPDILRTIANHKTDRPLIVVGFAAETQNVIENAKAKLASKNCDMIVANDVGADSDVMGGASNTVHIVTRDGVEDWPEMPKQLVAEKLMVLLSGNLKVNP
ncbi:Phosphopantothenoylcysteine decarboxylase / Phosphopantothenoylcysteine synthetase [hydrothermal vent metagenome]|uniref:Phosphopantothenoylcysteine decarboxylase / Phosphopantothenoylcysteine synthetase n=1 Tax=hydrothermal vent metagenome TaxID=652676 RepID=A0A3B0SEN2_9ZZZZ